MTIKDVILRGTTSADGWAKGVHVVDSQQTDLTRVYYLGQSGDITVGEAFSIDGTTDPTDHFLRNCRATWGGTGLKVRGTVEGVVLDDSTLLGVGRGIDWDTTAIETYLNATNNHINANTHCIYANNLLTPIFADNLLYELAGGGSSTFKFTELSNTYAAIYKGNTHFAFDRGNTKIGLEFSGTGGSSIVDDNIFYGASGDPIDTGILVGASNSNVYLGTGNKFVLTTAPYIDNSTTTRNEIYSNGSLVGTPTSGTGTLTSSAYALVWEKRGKRVRVTGAVLVTTAGTGAGELRAVLPFANGNVVAIGSATETNTGTMCTVKIVNNENFLRILRYDAATIIANTRSVTVDITYDAAT